MKFAIVVQRAYSGIVGGAEAEAIQYGRILQEFGIDVELLTTTSIDSSTWKNELEAGVTEIENLPARRFHVDGERSEEWKYLHEYLVRYYYSLKGYSHYTTESASEKRNLQDQSSENIIRWPEQLQEEWVRTQGPHSTELLEYLRASDGEFDRVIFFSYLYSPTYFGMKMISKSKRIFVPTLHDEPPAYLSIFLHAAKMADKILWNSNQEKQLGKRIWNIARGQVVGSWIDIKESTEFQYENLSSPLKKITEKPYILYSGRMDQGKGCGELTDYFWEYIQRTGSNLNLIFIGKGNYVPPGMKNIYYAGFVSDDIKNHLLKGALVYVMPSSVESLSISTLEAMGHRRPVLVNGNSDVLAEHIARSSGGLSYYDKEGFIESLSRLEGDVNLRETLGDNGRNYVETFYSKEAFVNRLFEAVDLRK